MCFQVADGKEKDFLLNLLRAKVRFIDEGKAALIGLSTI